MVAARLNAGMITETSGVEGLGRASTISLLPLCEVGEAPVRFDTTTSERRDSRADLFYRTPQQRGVSGK